MSPDETRSLRILVVSAVTSKIADYGLLLVVPLAVLASTGSVAGAIFTFALRGIAYAASPIIGALIDRFDRRTTYVTSQVLQGICVAVSALFLDNPWVVGPALLVSGFGGVAASITGQFVLIPELIGAGRRAVAVARLASAIEFAKVAGFLGGGAALSVLPPGPSAAAVAGCYLVAGLIAMRLPRVAIVSDRRSLWTDLKVGFGWLGIPEIGWLVASMTVSNLALGGLESVLVTVMGDGDTVPVVIAATLAVGLFAGGLGARFAPRILADRRLPSRILVFQLAAGFGLLVIAVGTHPWFLMAGYTALCFALGLSNVVSISFRQETIPVQLAGRVNSVIRMFIAGAIPLSGMLYAWVEAGGVWIWLPALVLQSLSLLIWSVFVVRTRVGSRRPA